LCPIDNEISGFELGGISITIDNIEISSKNKIPDQSMMIFLALSDLLTGIKNLWNGKNKIFKFIGNDSSFTILFKVKKSNTLELTYENKSFDVDFTLFRDECLKAIDNFYLKYAAKMKTDDPVCLELKKNLINFKKI
jgi:hypothetical protein